MRKSRSGFTIVELLIVIVVIAILAAISIIAYSGIQVRARDTLRADSIAKIERALELYKTDNGRYPTATSGSCDSWERSDCTADPFMEYLKNYGFPSGTPVDPINKMGPPNFVIFYYRYSPGQDGCPIDRGGFYVLRITYESAANKPSGGNDMFCPTRNWVSTSTMYLNSRFEN